MVLSALITAVGERDQTQERADCVVVPGHRLVSGGRYSSSLKARTEQAVGLLRQDRAGSILFTGGRVRGGISEARMGADLALALGAPPESIWVEQESRNTWENLRQARAYMQAQGWRSCLIASDPYHLLRCLLMARQLGLAARAAPVRGGPAYRSLKWRVYYTLGECGSLALYLLGRLVGWFR